MTAGPLQRVTMVNKYYPPHLGGVEYHMRDIAEGLVAHAGVGVRAIVCNSSNERAEETRAGVEVIRLPRAFERASTPVSWGFARELTTEACREPGPDIFHFHFPYPWGEMAWLQARPDKPMVVTYHSDIVRQKAALAAYRPFLERFLDSADLIMASSPNMIEKSEFLAKRSVKCRHVDYGLRVERFSGDESTQARADEIRAAHGGRQIVLFVGRLVYYKGVEVLVRAMEHIDADLVLIGKGPLESKLREIAVARGVSDRTTFLPPLDEKALAAWYRAADVFALPSVARSEAFGLVQIEAHAAGTPVISTDLPTSVPYANQDGVTGLVVPVGSVEHLAEALRTLLSDDELRSKLGKQAKARAMTRFSIPRMVESVMAAYCEATERYQSRRDA